MSGHRREALRGAPAWRGLALAAMLLAAAGCAAHRPAIPVAGTAVPPSPDDPDARRRVELAAALATLGPGVDGNEARRLAETALAYSRRLAAEYRLVRPPVWHNILVRVGLRERGLCWHWATDLMRRLQSMNLRTLSLNWAVAHQGSELLEHNSVVVTAAGKPFATGLVLDPWRNSGELYWSPVSADRYPWKPLPRRMWF